MFEIREFVDENDNIIRSDVVDLAKEMDAMKEILGKQQEAEEERIKAEYRKKRKECGDDNQFKSEENDKLKGIREKFDGYLKTFHRQGGNLDDDNDLDLDEEAAFIRDLEQHSRMGSSNAHTNKMSVSSSSTSGVSSAEKSSTKDFLGMLSDLEIKEREETQRLLQEQVVKNDSTSPSKATATSTSTTTATATATIKTTTSTDKKSANRSGSSSGWKKGFLSSPGNNAKKGGEEAVKDKNAGEGGKAEAESGVSTQSSQSQERPQEVQVQTAKSDKVPIPQKNITHTQPPQPPQPPQPHLEAPLGRKVTFTDNTVKEKDSTEKPKTSTTKPPAAFSGTIVERFP